MININYLSYLQLEWLNSKGGRDERDVLASPMGLFVNMYHPYSNDYRVYLPDDQEIIRLKNENKRKNSKNEEW